MEAFNSIIDYIEENLDKDIDIVLLARMAALSTYEFRRIFSFLTGVPINEYIRKRRMSVAAEELISGRQTVTEASIRYGYDSPSSFSRAFRDFHGISPANAIQNKNPLRTFTKFGFRLCVSGGEDFSYTVIEEPAFTVSGICGSSSLDDSECCEQVWRQFYESPCCKEESIFHGKIYAAYQNGNSCVNCYIGARDSINDTTAQSILIPASRWVCFKCSGTNDAAVNAYYNSILFTWLSCVGFTRNDALPNIEVFPYDMETDNFEWEIRIPVF